MVIACTPTQCVSKVWHLYIILHSPLGDYGYTALDERFLNFGPPPANNSASFALLVFDDELVEGTEDFFVNITLVETLGNPFSIILPQEVKVSIADDDGKFTVIQNLTLCSILGLCAMSHCTRRQWHAMVYSECAMCHCLSIVSDILRFGFLHCTRLCQLPLCVDRCQGYHLQFVSKIFSCNQIL